MPKTYGVKEKDVAVAHIVDQLLTGGLRSGDRVDRNEVAAVLGMSRVPVQEAVVQLEHDGILKTRYHRGAFVEQFDAEIVREHYEVYGLLSGVVSARAARNPTPRLLTTIGELTRRMRNEQDSAEFEDLVWEFRRTVNHEYAGPRLRAGIGTFQSLMPRAFWVSYADNHSVMLPFYVAENQALRDRDAAAAQAACAGRSSTMAEIVIGELIRRGVFDGDAAGISPAGPVPAARPRDTARRTQTRRSA